MHKLSERELKKRFHIDLLPICNGDHEKKSLVYIVCFHKGIKIDCVVSLFVLNIPMIGSSAEILLIEITNVKMVTFSP